MAKCEGCGTDQAIRVTCVWPKELGGHTKVESCDRCDGQSLDDGIMVDAAGQPISFPSGGFYSTAIGDRWWGSKREFANHIREKGLVARPDWAGKSRRNSDGLHNAPRR